MKTIIYEDKEAQEAKAEEATKMVKKDNTFKHRFANLLTVKSLVTLLFCSAYVYLTVKGKIPPEQFSAIVTTVVGFYFGVQSEKKDNL